MSMSSPLAVSEGLADRLTITVFDLSSCESDMLLLSVNELARASRFHFARDRIRYMSGRAMLRRILGQATGQRPESISFSYGRNGKPVLAGGPAFNLSHSGAIGAAAVAQTGRIGIDIEAMRPGFADLAIAERFFSPDETRRLRQQPVEEQEACFFRCWTRKEALLKAHGGGLTLPLHDFDVSFESHLPARVRRCGGVLTDGAWSLRDISDKLPPGWFGAVALDGHPAIDFVTFLKEEAI